ncbi:MAG: carbohydrate porin [Planctomycetes bacterium]|nr:carbohydrate porin [Planctomycetota bacterium]
MTPRAAPLISTAFVLLAAACVPTSLSAQIPSFPISPAGQDKENETEKGKVKNGDGKEPDKEKNGDDKEKDKEDEGPKWYSVHGQATTVTQGNWPFHSPYSGANSFQSIPIYHTTVTATLFLDVRVCEGGEVVFNPEIAGGRGLSSTLGIAGFPNGEATRVGAIEPTPYIARLFYRQTIGLGGEQEKVEDEPNRIAGMRDVHRLTFAVGKLSASDLFDNNSYSHDPRNQFLSWSLMNNGAWDYPANTRGYTYGATVEMNAKDWALRYGIFGEPAVANGGDIDPRFLHANGHAVELEQRWTLNERKGRLRLLAYLNNAHMGDYRVAVREMPVNPDISLTRAYRVKYGFGLNWEQAITEELGVYARLGWDDGHTEAWAFTEIDATAALGMLLMGKCWGRPKDAFGIAVVVNDLSNGHRAYLAAGGLGFILGDGRLSYGTEQILETYYNWELRKGINVTFDFQGVKHPAYNRDRGPVAIAGIRFHIEY